ncbi:20940_t:CDS:1 [Gigaspora margarita]|uniref:20940_t:CDS:1 n=1 Tax=Gigaspora margarita TaxID=4874 RepID=A0ABN7WIE5_GIGMA|nr:20940_t:CDS:1 [Gigaspora margarita]
MTKVITHQAQKLQQIISGREKPEWVKQFKSEWRSLLIHTINETYITNVEQWICSCPYYLTSRFGICKHLVQQKGLVSSKFFDRIKRNHQPLFLTERDYKLVKMVSFILHNNTEDNIIHSNIEDDFDENSNDLYNELITLITKTLNLLEEQKVTGNSRWIRNIKKNFTPISKMMEEIEQYKRKRTLPLTWKGHTNNTRFLE